MDYVDRCPLRDIAFSHFEEQDEPVNVEHLHDAQKAQLEVHQWLEVLHWGGELVLCQYAIDVDWEYDQTGVDPESHHDQVAEEGWDFKVESED